MLQNAENCTLLIIFYNSRILSNLIALYENSEQIKFNSSYYVLQDLGFFVASTAAFYVLSEKLRTVGRMKSAVPHSAVSR